ncbi:MAG: hypothetical protein ACI9WU_001176 [Myxococcota bacterium]|jgi:hypothetical protein
MQDYLFVWDRGARSYPIRFWVRAAGQSLSDAPPQIDEYDGIISADLADDLLNGLRKRFAEPAYVVERMSGTTWKSVAENFPGLYLH